MGVGSEEGAVPPAQKIFEILPENGAFWLHFLPYARFFQPKWPNGKYARGSEVLTEFVFLWFCFTTAYFFYCLRGAII